MTQIDPLDLLIFSEGGGEGGGVGGLMRTGPGTDNVAR